MDIHFDILLDINLDIHVDINADIKKDIKMDIHLDILSYPVLALCIHASYPQLQDISLIGKDIQSYPYISVWYPC